MKKIWARKAAVFEGVAISIGLWLFSCSNLYACSCAPQPTPQEALRDADAVFRGTAIQVGDVDMKEIAALLPMKKRIVLRVKTVWKGPHEKELVVLTGAGGGDCGFGFVLGGEYLVYAHVGGMPSGYHTGLCTRTRDVAWLSDRQNAQEDFQALGPGAPIVQ